jgi:hypothetical protein
MKIILSMVCLLGLVGLVGAGLLIIILLNPKNNK